MDQLYAALIAAAISIIGAAAAFVSTWLKSRANSKRLATLEEFINSDDTEYYIECPNCGQKIVLSKVKILIEKQNKRQEKETE